MTYTKNLGRVKGEKGDIYYPNLSYEGGNFKFTWTKEEDALMPEEGYTNLRIPIFIPNYDSNSGDLKFIPNIPVLNENGEIISTDAIESPYQWNIRGPKGDTARFDIKYTNRTYNELLSYLHQGNNSEYFNSSTFYMVKSSNANDEADIYVYDDEANTEAGEPELIKVQGIDLSDFYRKSQTYSRNEIDEMFDVQRRYLEEIFQLLDIEDNQEYELNGVALDDATLNTLLDEKLSGYVKIDDIEYVDVNGTLYFVQRGQP